MSTRLMRLVVLMGCAGVLALMLQRNLVSSLSFTKKRVEREVVAPAASSKPATDGVTHDFVASETHQDDYGDDDQLDDDEEVVRGSSTGINTGTVQRDPELSGGAVRKAEEVVTRGVDAPESDFSDDDARSIFTPLIREGEAVSNSDFFPAVLVGGAGVSAARAATPGADATPTTEDGALPWLEGQARGYTMLSAMHPSARVVVERQVQALLSARIRDIYIAVLIDGTFGQDFEYLRTVIGRLTSEGRRLTLVLYLSNGPTMRIWDSTPINALFSRINPREFRARIVREQFLQDQLIEVARKARRLFLFSRSLSPANTNIAIPMLEDNLDRNTYRVMRDLTRGEIREAALFMRNPCVGCFDGNDGDSLGDPREEHSLSAFAGLGQGDGFSLDGTGFAYPDVGPSNELSSEDTIRLMNEAYAKGLRYVGLWRHVWQGVREGIPNVHPDERNYRASSDDEIGFEIGVLRTGLRPVERGEAQNVQ